MTELQRIKQWADISINYFPTDNMSIGYGLVKGEQGTPYQDGFYIIKFIFPDEYPFKAPYCAHVTMSNKRQSPNFHDNSSAEGMVCLSRLDTWNSTVEGDHWKPILDIKYILEMIKLQVLTQTPLDNEPDYNHSTRNPINSANYDRFVTYHNYRSNVVDIYERLTHRETIVPCAIADKMATIIRDYVTSHYDEYLAHLAELQRVDNGIYVCCNTYPNSGCFCGYDELIEDFKRVYGSLGHT